MPVNCSPETRGKGEYGSLDAAGDGGGGVAIYADPCVDAGDEVVLRREDGRPVLLVEQDEGRTGHAGDGSILASALADLQIVRSKALISYRIESARETDNRQ